MKLDVIMKALLALVVIVGGITGFYAYNVYTSLCESNEVYEAVEIFYSDDAYKLCGNDFGIINVGTEDIEVTKLQAAETEEITTDNVNELASEVESVEVEAGGTLPIEASANIVYLIDSKTGSGLDHELKVSKF